jgi:nitrilase
VIVDPDGKMIAGPLSKEEGILYATVDPAMLTGPRWQLDTAGHYNRPDVFTLTIDRAPRPMLREAESSAAPIDNELAD